MAPLYNALLAAPSLEGRYHAAMAFLLVSDQLPVALVLALLLFIAHQFVLTHQFCGPIINFSNTFRAVAAGNLTRKVRLRKYDQLQAEAEGINAMIDGLTQLVSGMRLEQAGILTSLQDIAIAPDCAESRQKAEAALASARLQAERLSGLLSSFRLAEDGAERN
jgi:methyl-accepting chemotaxis protein